MQIKILAIAVIVAFIAGWQVKGWKVSDDVVDEIADEQEQVREIIKWKEKEKVVYRDRIQKIKVAQDPTGCLDSKLSDIGLSSLLPANQD